MHVPGPSNAYLVLFEDEMTRFTGALTDAIAWAIPVFRQYRPVPLRPALNRRD
jgi:hypothetical protein